MGCSGVPYLRASILPGKRKRYNLLGRKTLNSQGFASFLAKSFYALDAEIKLSQFQRGLRLYPRMTSSRSSTGTRALRKIRAVTLTCREGL